MDVAYTESIVDKSDLKPAQLINMVPAISQRNAKIVYENGHVGLEPTNLDIPSSKLTALLGPSGAGKSTLLRSLNGLVPLAEGSISTHDIGEVLTLENWRDHQQRTAMIFQSHQLIERRTVLENILTGRLGFRTWLQTFNSFGVSEKQMALECLERVRLLDKALERVSNLSGGQRQRVGIARALVQQPSIILADEPVASLDPQTSRDVMSFLRKLCDENNLTIVVSLHQVEIAKEFADQIVGISSGHVLFDGPAKDLSVEHLQTIYGSSYGSE